jgi:tetratricopeptide (TPR) repeat protein
MLVAPAAADDSDTCAKASGDVAIAACSRAIQSRKFSGHNLAVLFKDRGGAYNAKGDLDRAIGDYNEAIRLDAKYAPAYTDRCAAYFHKGNNDQAITDCTQAIRLDPKLALAFSNRGFVYQTKGDLEHAIADYSEAIRLNPKEPLG